VIRLLDLARRRKILIERLLCSKFRHFFCHLLVLGIFFVSAAARAETGFWINDPEFVIIGLSQGCYQYEVHYKTNGTTIENQNSIGFQAYAETGFCWTNYNNRFWGYSCQANDGSCNPPWDYWYCNFYNGAGDGFPPPGDWSGTSILSTGGETLTCGSFTNGKSGYNVVFIGPECTPRPNVQVTGSGFYYEIDFDLTPSCDATSWDPPSFPSPGISALIAPSTDTNTPSNGVLSGSNFGFSFLGSSSETYSIFASTNLVRWTNCGTVTLAGGATNGTFTMSNVTNVPELFFMVEDAAGNYSAPYGFITINLPAGNSMIADPLFNGVSQLSSILPSVPNGTTVSLWGRTNWGDTATFTSGSWNYDLNLVPGSGALINLSTNTSITFVGEVLQGNLNNNIPVGYSVLSSIVPIAGSVTQLGFTCLSNGDTLTRLEGTSYVTYTNIGSSWSPSVPSLNLCEAALVFATNSTSWSNSYATSTPQIFVAVASGDTNSAYSLDGINWTASANGLPSADSWQCAAYGNGTYVAIAEGDNNAAYSTNGIDWTASSMPTSDSWSGVCYGAGVFVAIALYDTNAAYSSDGIHWTRSALPGIGQDWIGVIYGKGLFVAISAASSEWAYSTNGVTWTAITIPDWDFWQSVAYGNGTFVAISSSHSGALYSTNGTDWISGPGLPSDDTWQSVTYGNGTFVAIAQGDNTAAYSYDGINWNASPDGLPVNDNWETVAYGNGMFIAISEGDNSEAYSTDGISWTASTMPFGDNWSGLTAGQ
jgi:hypothetical protein